MDLITAYLRRSGALRTTSSHTAAGSSPLADPASVSGDASALASLNSTPRQPDNLSGAKR